MIGQLSFLTFLLIISINEGKYMAKSEKTRLKNRLKPIFSQYIRLRDSDDKGYCKCCTCGAKYFWKGTKQLNAGHFITANIEETQFIEMNVHAQCVSCNARGGEVAKYAEFLWHEYGDDVFYYLVTEQETQKITEDYLKELIDFYKEEVKRLKKEKGLK